MRQRPYKFRDRGLPPRLSPDTIRDQILQFNQSRLAEFGRAPLPDSRLPIPYIGVGGDIAPPDESSDNG